MENLNSKIHEFSVLDENTLREINASIEHFERTGLHITLDEVKQWANELKSNRNAKLPKCHT